MYMTMEQARQEVKARLPEYLRSKGIDPRRPFRCLNPEHQDNSPSMSYDRNHNQVHCFACGASYDTFDLIGIDYGLTGKAIFDKAYELYNIQIEDGGAHHMEKGTFPKGHAKAEAVRRQQEAQAEREKQVKAYFDKCQSRIPQTDYFQQRGISAATVSRFPIGYDPNFKAHWGECQAVVFFTSPSSYEGRNIDPGAEKKHRYSYSRGSKHPFNLDALEQSRPVFVTEGIFDALSITEAGGNAIATTGVDLVKNFIKAVRERKEAGQEIPPIVAVFDNDNAGNGATEETVSLLKSLDVPVIDGRGILLDGCKDSNESLLKDRDAFIRNVSEMEKAAVMVSQADEEQEKDEYILSAYVSAYMPDFLKEAAETERICSTGFPVLDDTLGGGIYSGLYIVGAVSAMGKTTFVMQLADQAAAAGQDVLIFSLEMSKFELVAKSVSRLTLIRSRNKGRGAGLAQSARRVMMGKNYPTYTQAERDIIKEAVQDYAEGPAKHIKIIESVGDTSVLPNAERPGESIREIVARHIKMTGQRPIVVVDYIQILKPADPRMSDKQAADTNIVALKQLTRDFRIAVIGISSFNRNSYLEPVSMSSFKESGGLEYSADCLLGLQPVGLDYEPAETDKKRAERLRDLDKEIKHNKREGKPIDVELKIIKQRFAAPGFVGFQFWSRYNLYDESMGDFVSDNVIPLDMSEQTKKQKKRL